MNSTIGSEYTENFYIHLKLKGSVEKGDKSHFVSFEKIMLKVQLFGRVASTKPISLTLGTTIT